MPRLAWLILALPLLAADSSDYARAVARARGAIDAGRAGEALAALDEALRASPEGLDAFMLLGRATLQLGRNDEAVAAFGRAAALAPAGSPGQLDALSGMADAQARSEKNVEALATLEKIRAMAPDRPGVQHDIGMIHFALGRLEAAAEAFRKEMATTRDEAIRAATREQLGITAYRLGDDAAALQALEKGSGSAEAAWYKGLALARLGRHEEALAALRAVTAKEPGNRGALQAIARSAAALGRTEEQRAALAAVAESYRREEEARSLKNRLFDLRAEADRKATAGDAPGAVAAMEAAVALDAKDMSLLFDLGRIHERVKQPAGAEAAYRRVLALDPGHAEAHLRLGRLLAERGEVAAAIPELERAAALSPMTPAYRIQLARAYLRAGRSDDGVRELRLARRLSPQDPESAFNLGLGLATAGQMREAAAEMEAAARLGYGEPQLYLALVRVYAALGETEKGRAAQEALDRVGKKP